MDYFIGVDLGGTAIKLGIVDQTGTIVDSSQVPTITSSRTSDAILDNIKNSIKQLIDKNQNINIKGLGIGIPGGVSIEKGIVENLPNIPELNGVAIAKNIEEYIKIPCFMDNDANNAARGEFIFGNGKGLKNFIVITLGTGIGGGIFINGELYGGSSNYAGEIGHMVIVPGGRPCGCGNFGCWEAYGSATAMIKKAKILIEKNLDTSLKKYYPNNINAKTIEDEARAGDLIANEIINEAMKYVGLGISNLINIFNPDAIIVGGGVSNGGEFILNKIINSSYEHTLSISRKNTKILLAKLGNKAGILGSAALAIMQLQK